MMITDIAAELIKMAEHDLRIREELLKEGKLSQGYHPMMESVHKKNAARLDEIIDTVGYPTKSMVGAEASEAAWLIIQHAISEPAFMKKCYRLIAEAADDTDPKNFAYLHDRICYFEGRPQKFGTQFDARGMYPVEDLAAMVRLRKELHFSTHEEGIITEYKSSGGQKDLHPDDKEFNLWRKKVGWI